MATRHSFTVSSSSPCFGLHRLFRDSVAVTTAVTVVAVISLLETSEMHSCVPPYSCHLTDLDHSFLPYAVETLLVQRSRFYS